MARLCRARAGQRFEHVTSSSAKLRVLEHSVLGVALFAKSEDASIRWVVLGCVLATG